MRIIVEMNLKILINERTEEDETGTSNIDMNLFQGNLIKCVFSFRRAKV